MPTLVTHLSNYAEYHQNKRNIASHMLGIPIIVLAMAVLTSRPALEVGNATLTLAMLLSAFAALFYLRLDWRFGSAMAVLLALASWLGFVVSKLPTSAWLITGVSSFVVGWIVQFIGHHCEGRKPAFLDDISGLIIGPLFVVAEFTFLLGLRLDVRDAIAMRSGPAGL